MQLDKWIQTVGNIKDTFEVLNEGREHIDDEGGVDIEYIEFSGPLGHMRLEFITKPLILDRKTNYSRRIGSETDVKYVYSKDEKTHILEVYKKNETTDDWEEVEVGNLFS